MNGTSQAGMSALNAVPTNAGYSMDLSFVLEKINELSQQLQINRAQSSDIVAKVQEIRVSLLLLCPQVLTQADDTISSCSVEQRPIIQISPSNK